MVIITIMILQCPIQAALRMHLQHHAREVAPKQTSTSRYRSAVVCKLLLYCIMCILMYYTYVIMYVYVDILNVCYNVLYII